MTVSSSPRSWVRFDAAVGSVICARVGAGESLMAICRDPDLPCRATVKSWRARSPAFGAQLAEAFRRGRANPRGGRRSVWHPAVAALICQRIAEGMTMAQACDLPGLPCPTSVYGWLRTRPDFAEQYGQARMIQAHRRFDQVWELAQAATPATAAAVRLRIEAAKWQAARMAPKRYGVRAAGLPAEAEAGGEPHLMQSARVIRFYPEPGEPEWEEVCWPLVRPGPRRAVASADGFPEDRAGPGP